MDRGFENTSHQRKYAISQSVHEKMLNINILSHHRKAKQREETALLITRTTTIKMTSNNVLMRMR